MHLNHLIRRAGLADIAEVSLNLRDDDIREVVEGGGINPVLSILHDYLNSDAVVFHVPNGKTAGIAGVSDDGCVWMLCTPAIEEYPVTFVREARRWIESLPHAMLHNRADIRNTTHLKLLKHLGFKFLQVIPDGPNNILFVEFVKLCQSPHYLE